MCIDPGILALLFLSTSNSKRLSEKLKKLKKLEKLNRNSARFLRRRHPYGSRLWLARRRRFLRLSWSVLTLPSLFTVVLALNLSMFGDIRVGWKMLAYGLAAGAGFSMLAGGLYLEYLSFIGNLIHNKPN